MMTIAWKERVRALAFIERGALFIHERVLVTCGMWHAPRIRGNYVWLLSADLYFVGVYRLIFASRNAYGMKDS
jgi:hypothetical protein